ncbi:MAG: tRNA preQ1(34) S-adenosylmethionine ribosyltransferase-isomerase QueA [Terracidiphilus sp.]|jgi:S-adenosylmethionine:tRNA ribosyltransferase-isomerase
MTGLRVADFDFDLPPELIAQQPPAERSQSRMLAMDRATGALRDMTFGEFPSLLQPGDLLVLNDSRVIPARLYARRTLLRDHEKPTGRIEVLLTEPVVPQMLGAPSLRLFSGARVGNHESQSTSVQQQLVAPGPDSGTWETTDLNPPPTGENLWRALVKPGRKVGVGERLLFPAPSGEIALEAEILERGEFGARLLRFEPVADFFAVLDRIGHVPLPPYIRRGDEDGDRERYQTVFAREPGSVAAPTAGLHFTPRALQELAAKGVEVARITLHVGLGTFAPLRVETLDEVRLHRERYTLSAAAADAVNRAMSEGRRIVAVGTTVVRTLEAAAQQAKGCPLQAHSGETDIFISPGFEFRLVGALLTNFHLPQSSLLMLVSAFAGREAVLAACAHAVAQKYRFFSYGDCMFIV